MATSMLPRHLSENGALVERHWQELNSRRRLYSWLGFAVLLLALSGSLCAIGENGTLREGLSAVRVFCDRDLYGVAAAAVAKKAPSSQGAWRASPTIRGMFSVPRYANCGRRERNRDGLLRHWQIGQ